jgi:hypothetical protein
MKRGISGLLIFAAFLFSLMEERHETEKRPHAACGRIQRPEMAAIGMKGI